MNKISIVSMICTLLFHMVGCHTIQQLQINTSTKQDVLNRIIRIETKDSTIIRFDPDSTRQIVVHNESIFITSQNDSVYSIPISHINKCFYYGFNTERTLGGIIFGVTIITLLYSPLIKDPYFISDFK